MEAVATESDGTLGLAVCKLPPEPVVVKSASGWAAAQGFRPDCRVTEVNGQPIDSLTPELFKAALAQRPLRIKFLPPTPPQAPGALEVEIGPSDELLGCDIGSWSPGHLRISGVRPGSLAERRGVRAGWLLAGLNGVSLTDMSEDEFKHALMQRPVKVMFLAPTDAAGVAGSPHDDPGPAAQMLDVQSLASSLERTTALLRKTLDEQTASLRQLAQLRQRDEEEVARMESQGFSTGGGSNSDLDALRRRVAEARNEGAAIGLEAAGKSSGQDLAALRKERGRADVEFREARQREAELRARERAFESEQEEAAGKQRARFAKLRSALEAEASSLQKARQEEAQLVAQEEREEEKVAQAVAKLTAEAEDLREAVAHMDQKWQIGDLKRRLVQAKSEMSEWAQEEAEAATATARLNGVVRQLEERLTTEAAVLARVKPEVKQEETTLVGMADRDRHEVAVMRKRLAQCRAEMKEAEDEERKREEDVQKGTGARGKNMTRQQELQADLEATLERVTWANFEKVELSLSREETIERELRRRLVTAQSDLTEFGASMLALERREAARNQRSSPALVTQLQREQSAMCDLRRELSEVETSAVATAEAAAQCVAQAEANARMQALGLESLERAAQMEEQERGMAESALRWTDHTASSRRAAAERCRVALQSALSGTAHEAQVASGLRQALLALNARLSEADSAESPRGRLQLAPPQGAASSGGNSAEALRLEAEKLSREVASWRARRR